MTPHQVILTVIGFFTAVALVVIVALAPNYAHAETVKPRPKPPQCGTMAQMKTALKAISPPVQVSEVGPYGTSLFLSQFNAMEPVSNIVGDHTLIVEVAGDDRISVVFFKDGCLEKFNAISRNALRHMMRTA